MGRYVFCHEGGDRVISTVYFGWDAALFGGAGPVSHFTVADRNPANGRAMEDGGDHRCTTALHRERRCVLGRTDCTVGNCSIVGGDGDALDGNRGLVEAGRAEAFGANSVWDRGGIRGNGDSCWPGAVGAFGQSEPGWRRSIGDCVVGMGMRVAPFEAWIIAEFSDARRGDARTLWRGSIVDCRSV